MPYDPHYARTRYPVGCPPNKSVPYSEIPSAPSSDVAFDPQRKLASVLEHLSAYTANMTFGLVAAVYQEKRGPDYKAHLADIAKMMDGWRNGNGVAPSKEAMRIASLISHQVVVERHLSAPYIAANPDGGVHLEWPVGGNGELTIDVSVGGEEVYFDLMSSQGDEEMVFGGESESLVDAVEKVLREHGS